ncbi:MAG: bifunctional (p)ppGpp synthetase/guanosine-3',5'-bis(diphosphate) 3'-pyrophosphohydrolase [Deltaproteobacteria bacterium]|nr:MAG: bifunctional (p)ppGpp synthetase/guanosine-3',5'-bis(diphosphate) 3'-pyrophosphohydrolase [Deltaproteobacteria bacterium]
MLGSMSSSLSLLMQATLFAARKHRTQHRHDTVQTPYINHPIEVAEVLSRVGGVDDVAVLCAALLHDTVEDTTATYAELVEKFGHRIADLVMEVTDDKTLPKQVRKDQQVEKAPGKSYDAKLVSLADKICNVRSLPIHWPDQRCLEYFLWSKRVVDGMRGTHVALEALFDAEVEPRITEYKTKVSQTEST